MSVGNVTFSAGNTLWQKFLLKCSRSYVHQCAHDLSALLGRLAQEHLTSAERIEHATIKSARFFFKVINQKFKSTDQKIRDCWDLYRATVLGISVQTYSNSDHFPEFAAKPPLERYLAEHCHELKEVDGKLQILFDGVYTDWDTVWEEYEQFEILEQDDPGRPVIDWNYGKEGVQKKDMFSWGRLEPYKKEDPNNWGCRYVFEFCVTCTTSRLRATGDHSWFRLKDPEGNIYSVGKYLAAKIEKGAMFPFRVKRGYLMSPDVSEYWPQTIYRLPVEITKEQFEEIIESVNEDKTNESQMVFQVFRGNCQEYVNEKAKIANIHLPTSRSIVRLIFPVFLQEVYDRLAPKLHATLLKVLHAVGSFFMNGLLAILGNGAVDKKVKEQNIASTPHLDAKNIFNREKLVFHPPTYVAHQVFNEINSWRKAESNAFGLPKECWITDGNTV
jgi:hypothetical protein